ncbi:Hypothetical predicted protein [Marmota monax]|uniref:Fibronectin type-III domain-containing protein n=1 Tax=Marmota monax TaxID=9995 RepID=A0A5E4CG74_MARMO|nr:hypothetical protein GHT09_003555 [Marmota monax]VTJ80887.1 Hypothetical predicted protein [Marmota monax]
MIHVHWRSTNDDATYTVTAQGEKGLYQCSSTGESCTLGDLPCGSVFSVTAVAETQAGWSLPSYSMPLETEEHSIPSPSRKQSKFSVDLLHFS